MKSEARTGEAPGKVVRVAILLSHPIQHFAPWFGNLAERDDIELRVLYFSDFGAQEYEDVDFGQEIKWDIPLLTGYDHRFLLSRRRSMRLGFFQVDHRDTASELSDFGAEVIIVFGYRHRAMWRARAWAAKNHCLLVIYSDSAVVKAGRVWMRPIKEQVVRFFYGQLDAALAVGDANRDYHQHFGIPSNRIFECALPVDAERLSREGNGTSRDEIRARYGISSDAFVCLFVGKLTARKRPGDLGHAILMLKEENRSIVALVVGEGPERPSLEEVARRSDGRVVAVGFVNQSEVASYYRASDVLVVPSGQDPHPLVVTEASVLGLPLVVSDRVTCVGPNDTARPNKNAIVYPCGQVDRLASSILELSRDQKRLREMRQQAIQIGWTQDIGRAGALLAAAVGQLTELGRRRKRFGKVAALVASLSDSSRH